MSTPDPDAYWRRPADGEQSPTERSGPADRKPPAGPVYQGPPRSAPPPPGWRTPVVAEQLPPRQMPVQDHAAMDAAEREARAVTYGVGILAAAVMLILLIVVCVRMLG